jgi:hypothetical protein
MRAKGLCLLLIAMLAGCSTNTGGTIRPQTSGGSSNGHSLPAQFAHEQGYAGWGFSAAVPGEGTYTPLAWTTAPTGLPYALTSCWVGDPAPQVLIARDRLRPGDGREAVITWQVPTDGTVQLSATFQSLLDDAGGDGVVVTIYRNAARISGPALLPNTAGQANTLTALQRMSAGETVFIRIDPGKLYENDWYGYRVDMVIR